MFASRRLDPERLPETAAFYAVQWDPAGEVRFWNEDGYVPVKTPAGSSDPDVLAYVRFLRDDCPKELQHGWPAYCRAIALPLVRSEYPGRPPRPFERRSVLPWYDPVYGGVMLALQAVGLALWAVTGAPHPAMLGAVAGGVYAAARWWYGRSGVPRLLVLYHGESLRREFLLAGRHFLLAGGGVATMIWFGNGGWPVWLWAPAGLLPVTASTIALDRAQKRTVRAVEDRRTADALAEWDALHADPQRDPAWQAALWNGTYGDGPATSGSRPADGRGPDRR